MSTQKKLQLKITIYFIGFFIFIGLSIVFFFKAQYNHQQFEKLKNAEIIKENMPIAFVIKRFGISQQEIFQELKLSANRWNKRYTIKQACNKNKLDCQIIINNLNKKISKGTPSSP